MQRDVDLRKQVASSSVWLGWEGRTNISPGAKLGAFNSLFDT